jgi:hypothetical protein
MSNQPAHKIRIGNLTAVIWRNLGEKGNWYTSPSPLCSPVWGPGAD